ncbi:MAG TPA: hypothetical protein VNB87_16990 [Propionibacteriaceae bacterium]|nr:hypothetical protein [Propionibacteriaceae bacterium]
MATYTVRRRKYATLVANTINTVKFSINPKTVELRNPRLLTAARQVTRRIGQHDQRNAQATVFWTNAAAFSEAARSRHTARYSGRWRAHRQVMLLIQP